MIIEGTYTLQASPEDVSDCLTDAQTLQRTVPGVERLEALGEHKYALALNIGPEPLAGHYQGHVTVIEQQHPGHFHFTFVGEGQQSRIRSDWTIALHGHAQYTVVAYKANVSLGKPGKSMPVPLVKGAIKLLIQELFASLAHQLPAISSSVVVTDEHFETLQPGQTTVVSSPDVRPTLAHTIVRLLHLGAGDARAEEQWARRVRRFGITSILLLLVWVGTKLPRR